MCKFGGLHLGEDEVGDVAAGVGSGSGSTAIEFPIPERENDDVRKPDGGAGGEKFRWVATFFAVNETSDERCGAVSVGKGHCSDECEAGNAEAS